MSVRNQFSAMRVLRPTSQAIIDKICKIAESGPEQVAKIWADKVAFPETKFWRHEYNRRLQDIDGEWQAKLAIVDQELDSTRFELRELKSRHDRNLVAGFENQLAPDLAELHDAISGAQTIIDGVKVATDREEVAVERTCAVWKGTQAVNAFAARKRQPLNEDDRSLARSWMHSLVGNEEFLREAMESARTAELVAIEIYREIHGHAEDLSILQNVAPSDSRWKTADIDTGGRWIDVKNARRRYPSGDSYSEHLVKQFKSAQHNQQRDNPVVVSGILSPYWIDSGEPAVWLGEITLDAIRALRSQFQTKHLELNLDPPRFDKQHIPTNGREARIPPWLFDFPADVYSKRDEALALTRSHGFVLPRSDCPLGLLVLAGCLEPGHTQDPLSIEAFALAERIAAGDFSRPLLFLHILDRFCCTARMGEPFPSNALRQIMFAAESPHLAGLSDEATPLAVSDPLKTVKELIDVLEKVSEVGATEAVEFTSFRLSRKGVFEGRRNASEWQTIFAYCGGWRKLPSSKDVPCGQNPLFLGQNEPCGECRKLVCRTCGYCSKNKKKPCSLCSPRQSGWPAPVLDARGLP